MREDASDMWILQLLSSSSSARWALCCASGHSLLMHGSPSTVVGFSSDVPWPDVDVLVVAIGDHVRLVAGRERSADGG
eukprot:7386280-Prymnesium_polylepis.1